MSGAGVERPIRKLTIWPGTHKRSLTPPRTKPSPSGDPLATLTQIIKRAIVSYYNTANSSVQRRYARPRLWRSGIEPAQLCNPLFADGARQLLQLHDTVSDPVEFLIADFVVI